MKKCLLVVCLSLCSIYSAEAVTCSDVRALSREQQAYYIKAYNITPAQQAQIRATCYGRKSRLDQQIF